MYLSMDVLLKVDINLLDKTKLFHIKIHKNYHYPGIQRFICYVQANMI